ncbi:GRF zinc finger motif-containing protein [Pandoravirus inopinatum]|uniref:GRF zinc finger motif-containing protein n=1 Tax=Pandoravirus inopinatum TaxID=1605721 RepID=A0A0B5J343_9VIRU|nr:GRF zinc finger motif-containing protein [Pandoravirus inopinatum]AJF98014.1 GRF zinc finger motif-containing protein [Pandoravirus inopinatum]
MQPHQPHQRPTAAPLPEPKRQRVDGPMSPVSASANDDDAAFWLAAVQETSSIVARGTAQPAPLVASRAQQQQSQHAPVIVPRSTPAVHHATATSMRTTAPLSMGSSVPSTVRAAVPPATSRPAQPLPPPCLFGISTVPRVRPPMAGSDESDDSYQRGGSSRGHRPSLVPNPMPASQQPPMVQRPPVLFTGAAAAKSSLPPPVITPYVPLSAASSSLYSSSPSSSSYARGDTQARPGHETAIEGIFCKCNGGTREPKTAVTRSGANAGRRYYACPQRNQSGGCDFWLWHDEHGKARAAPARDPRAPHYREHLAHDLLHASGGRTVERLVVLAREASAAGTADSAAPSLLTMAADKQATVAATANAWIEAVTDRWHVTRPVATDPSETDAAGAARRMPLVDLDLPMGDAARAACHPHTAREIACTALLAHMFALRGWRVVVQPPQMAFYQHVHLYIARGHYDKEAYWVRVEPARRLDPRDPPDTPVQYESLWVQTAGPHPDGPGWLTGSHVDLVAFEGAEGFLLVDRRRLWRYIDRHVMHTPAKAATTSSAPTAATPAAGPTTVTDPAQADHRLLDMGAVGQCPHERRTLLALEALFQHDDVARERHRDAPAKAKVVVEETLFFDPAVAGPYLARMGRPALPTPTLSDPPLAPPPSTDGSTPEPVAPDAAEATAALEATATQDGASAPPDAI